MDGMSNDSENTPKAPHPGGRPTKYHKAFVKIVYKLCRQHGYTDEKLADLLSVGISTFMRWKDAHVEFREALRRGKDEFDSENVEAALLERAKGYVRQKLVTKTFRRRGREVTETHKIVEKVAGSVRAQELWLCNRNPGRWKRIPREDDGTGLEQKSGVLVVPPQEDFDAWLNRHQQATPK